MKLVIEKGRMLKASCLWVHFIIRNADIMPALSKSPLRVALVKDRHFSGKIFGVELDMEVLGDTEPRPSGEIDIVSDIRMPARSGRTHTVAHYKYRLLDADVTMVELQFTLETVGIAMSLYACMRRRQIDNYVNEIISDTEQAVVLVQNNDPSLTRLLSEEQVGRIAQFRATYGDKLVADERRSPEESQAPIRDKREWDSELLELTSLYQNVRGRANELENELVRIRETRDTVATLLIARRMLELIVSHVCQRELKRPRGNDPLSNVIDKIAKVESVPEYVITSMNNLNRLSTYGAHPKEFSPRQVREAIIALCSIMEWYAEYCQRHGDT